MAVKKRAKKRRTSKKRPTKRRPAKRRTAKKRVVKKRLAKGRIVKGRRPKKKGKLRRKPAAAKGPKEKILGIVTHYFPQVRAAAIKLKAPLSIGDTIKIKGHTTDFSQTINSLQVDRQTITTGKRGQEIGLLVDYRVRHNDKVYKV